MATTRSLSTAPTLPAPSAERRTAPTASRRPGRGRRRRGFPAAGRHLAARSPAHPAHPAGPAADDRLPGARPGRPAAAAAGGGTGPAGADGPPTAEGAGHPLVRIDTVQRTAEVDGRQLDLTYLEFELLAHLVAHPHRVHTRDQLVTTVWGYGHVGDGRTVDVHIARLRRKLGAEHRGSRSRRCAGSATSTPRRPATDPVRGRSTARLVCRRQIRVPCRRSGGHSHRHETSDAGWYGVRRDGPSPRRPWRAAGT